jgi:hypothetical protein
MEYGDRPQKFSDHEHALWGLPENLHHVALDVAAARAAIRVGTTC